MTRRPWTEADDAHLRKFYAEGKIDRDLAYILSRSHSAIARRRRALGLKATGTAGFKKGEFKHSTEAKAKIGAATLQRWQTDENYRATTMEKLQAGRKASQYKGWKIPTDPDARKYYLKVRKHFRAKYAREALAAITSMGAFPV